MMNGETDNTLPDSEMETLRTCQDCGTVMPASHTGSICPKCVLGLAAESPAAQLGEAEGDVIGPYTFRQKLGEGGFGVVWMAEQSQPMSRMVALKVVKAGMDTKQVLARFEAEQQALALLDHTNIAKVLDAGATETGRPYFVMELVKGIPITQFCQEQKLATKARLELFRDVCSAINHAHQKGIIHRDLKPSNVMVTLHGDKPVAKVIDFGIAKATQQKLTDKTLFTRFEQFLGTPVYMSPEQAALSGLDIDTRSDIYSLGVLLYELLAGKPPFDPKTLLSKGYEEMRRIIREEEPPKPSTKLTETQSSAGDKMVNVSPSTLKGELDWIVMKAIDKVRARRYETANAFAADIGRFLEDEPVLAAAPSAAYKFRKFTKRNRTPLSVAALIALSLLGVTGICLWQTYRKQQATELAEQRLAESEQARVEADRARKEAQGVSSYFTGLLEDTNAIDTHNGRSVTVVAILDDAVRRLETELNDQPTRRAQLQFAIGSTYQSLGLIREAIPLQKQVLEFLRTKVGSEHVDTLVAMLALAESYNNIGQSNMALEMQEEVLKLARRVWGLEHSNTLAAMGSLAVTYATVGRSEEALAMQENVLRLRRKISGPEHPYTLTAMTNLAVFYGDEGRYSESLELNEKLYQLKRATLGPEHPSTLLVMHNLAAGFQRAGHHRESMAMFEELLALRRKVIGPEHYRTLRTMSGLAGSYWSVGRHEEALAMRKQVLTLTRKTYGPNHPDSLSELSKLAASYSRNVDPDQQINGYKYLVSLYPERADSHYRLGKYLFNAERHEEALTPLRTALTHYSSGEQSMRTRVRLMRSLQALGRDKEANAVKQDLIRSSSPVDAQAPLPVHVLLPSHSHWRWLHPTDGTDPAKGDEDFHQTFFKKTFDDSAWQTGQDREGPNGGFGYGDNWFDGVDIGQPKSKALGYAAYFRAHFSTTLAHQNLELRCQRDDGIIVYLDGEEVARDNMVPGQEAYLLPATTTVGSLDEQQRYRIPLRIGNLPAGEHILAISLHNTEAPSSDLRIGGISLVEVNTAADSEAIWTLVQRVFESGVLRDAGNAAASRLNFDLTAAHFEKIKDDFPEQWQDSDNYRYGAALAFLGKRGELEALAIELAHQYTVTKNSDLPGKLAKTLSSLPNRAEESAPIRELRKDALRLAKLRANADGARSHDHYGWYALSAGQAEFRLGNLTSAEVWFGKALSSGVGDRGALSLSHAFRSMTRHQMGRKGDAIKDLEKGVDLLPKVDYSNDWWNAVHAYLALREAWELIEGKEKKSEALENWAK